MAGNAITPISDRPQPAAKPSLVARMAERFAVDSDKLMATLKQTAFRQRADRDGNAREATNEEMMALLVIADQYGLNPFTRELYAFLDPKSKAIVPIVSVDGWYRIINERPELRSFSFTMSPEKVEWKGKVCHEWMECEIVRSDREKPIVIREYFAEVVRSVDFATPWDTHPNRMHRHKVLIQCARAAFGFGGVYDDDEASRIIEGTSTRLAESSNTVARLNSSISGGVPTSIPTEAAAKAPVESTATRVEEDVKKAAPAAPATKKAPEAAPPTYAYVAAQIANAKTIDDLDVAVDLISSVADGAQRAELDVEGRAKRTKLSGK